jgi:hypothetical protein
MGALLQKQLAARGIDPATTPRRSKLGRLARGSTDGVLGSSELTRILELPRRDWRTDPDTPAVVAAMTALYKTPGGTMTLLPHQAWALLEAEDHGGLFGDIPVGEGKTIISKLLPLTRDYKRPMLLVPGNLVEKTEREFAALSQHWRSHPGYRIVSFELLGSPKAGPELLETYMPDCLVIDEAHGFKNPRAGRTKRLMAYIEVYGPSGRGVLKAVFTKSGTYHEDSLTDFHHLQKWSLPPRLRILPDSPVELKDWCSALDTDPTERLAPGALTVFSGGETDLKSVRQGFAARKAATPGVIVVESEGPGCSITLEADVFNGYGPAVDAAFERLGTHGERTDGCPVKEAIVAYMHQWTYALGYESYWDPEPPPEWREALRGWSTCCRVVMAREIDKVDTPAMVANAIDRGDPRLPLRVTLADGTKVAPQVLLAAWRLAEPTFKVNVKERRIDDAMTIHAAEWLATASKRKLLWTRHVPFARRLSEVSGVPYFGAGGLDAKGRSIETYHGGPAILSIEANKLGRNLQDRYDQNYIVDPMGTCKDWDQVIGRTHRRWQKADVVSVRVLVGCLSHFTALARARQRATNVGDSRTPKVDRKLLLVDWLVPPAAYFAGLSGPRWEPIRLPGRDEFA